MKRKYLLSTVLLVLFFTSVFESSAYASTVQEVDLRSANYPGNYIDGMNIYDQRVSVSSTIGSYRLHFARIATAANDRVSVTSSYSGTSQEAGTIYLTSSGYSTDIWTPWITGPAYINLITTNDGNVSTGFVVDYIEYTGTSSPLINANAFYPNSFSSVSNLSVYQAPSVATYGYSTMVTNGLNSYDAITNANIGFTASTSTTAQVRISANNTSGLDFFAITQPYTSSGKAISSIETTTWGYATVVINNAVMNSWGLTTTNKQKVITHELGHILSLNHQTNLDVNSIMKTGKLTITSPSSVDISNIQYKW
ncbi:M43 family zinc metalloprotease [Paenibacillus tengchongensis]|uniref:M43 family zinc metalloprotease n=1 Tax=Paenibacillus tengchongensis TaxID=2608684 RepID=UPI00124DC5F3|nr:M43 family zinc metalloprotease [Paenibacillus tengchongensis]